MNGEAGKTKDLARMLLTIGIAVAGSVAGSAITIASQFEVMKEKSHAFEAHMRKSHPSVDYRKLLDERHRSIGNWQSRHERNHP